MIRMKFRDDGELFQTLLLEDRPDIGPELRQLKAPGCDAGPTATVDVPRKHCNACSSTIADLLGLRPDEIERIKRWREAKDMTPDERRENNMTPTELGVIIDKIAEQLDAGEADCEDDEHRIVVEVESEP